MAVLLRCCAVVEVVANRVLRREVVIALAIIFILSYPLASLSEAFGLVETAAILGFCFLAALWCLNKGQQELLGKP